MTEIEAEKIGECYGTSKSAAPQAGRNQFKREWGKGKGRTPTYGAPRLGAQRKVQLRASTKGRKNIGDLTQEDTKNSMLGPGKKRRQTVPIPDKRKTKKPPVNILTQKEKRKENAQSGGWLEAVGESAWSP